MQKGGGREWESQGGLQEASINMNKPLRNYCSISQKIKEIRLMDAIFYIRYGTGWCPGPAYSGTCRPSKWNTLQSTPNHLKLGTDCPCCQRIIMIEILSLIYPWISTSLLLFFYCPRLYHYIILTGKGFTLAKLMWPSQVKLAWFAPEIARDITPLAVTSRGKG